MARQWAAAGHDLALCARRTDRLDALAEQLTGRYPDVQIATRRLDVTDPAAVTDVFAYFRQRFGRLDRVVVNAGIGHGAKVGTGAGGANRRTMLTNAVAALDQAESALAILRDQHAGHLVLIASVAGVRGLPGTATAYSASKAAVVALGQGLRAELFGSAIEITTVLPGYIRTEINASARRAPFMIDLSDGARLLVEAIDREPATVYVPRWPWAPAAQLLRVLPTRLVARAR